MAITQKNSCHYFGPRHDGSKPAIKHGIHYTMETLRYMTPYLYSKKIIDLILKRIPINKQPFDVIETSGGIGGDTLTFAQSPYFNRILSFEPKHDRAMMLCNNLREYRIPFAFQKEPFEKTKAKVTVVRRPFETVALNSQSIVYIDPPWASPDNPKPGAYLNKTDFMTQNIKLGDDTLEDLIDSSKAARLIALKLPLAYKIKKRAGFNYEKVLLRNKMKIIFIIK